MYEFKINVNMEASAKSELESEITKIPQLRS